MYDDGARLEPVAATAGGPRLTWAEELRAPATRPALLAFGALLGLDALMLALELVNRASGVYAPLLLLQEESNVPTWAGAAQMLGAGVCAFLLGVLSTARTRRAWCLVAAGLALLSMDDATRFHERAAEYVDYYPVEPLFYGIFVVLVLVGLYVVRTDLRRRSVTAGPLVLAGLTTLAAAVFLDAVVGFALEDRLELASAVRIVEEMLELVGTTFVLGALLLALVTSVRLVPRAREGAGPSPG